MCAVSKYIWISCDRVSLYTCTTVYLVVDGGGSVHTVYHLRSTQGKPFSMIVCSVSSSIN
jgi:hypothetical protein